MQRWTARRVAAAVVLLMAGGACGAGRESARQHAYLAPGARGARCAVGFPEQPAYDLAALTRASALVLSGRVTAVADAPRDPDGATRRVASVAPERVYKGRAVGSVSVGFIRLDCTGTVYPGVTLVPGERAILFLEGEAGDVYSIAGLEQGKWTIGLDGSVSQSWRRMPLADAEREISAAAP